MPVPVDLDDARGRAAVGPDLPGGVEERPVVLGRNVPVRILHRAKHVQAPGRALGKIWRAAAHAELRAARDRFRAVLDLAVERAHLPIVPSRTRLDYFE